MSPMMNAKPLLSRSASALLLIMGTLAVAHDSRLGAASTTESLDIVDLGLFHGSRAEGRVINNQGRILCFVSPASGSGWILSESGVDSVLMNPLGGLSATFSGLNDQGYLSGTVTLAGPRGATAFILTPGGSPNLAPPNTDGHGLNSLGAGVGTWNTTASFGPFYPPFGVRRAMRFFGGSLKDLGTLSPENPFSDSDALAINNLGTVVGWSTLGGKIGKKAVRWVGGGKIEDLHLSPVEGRTNSAAIAIGDDGTVSGYAFNFPTAMDAIPFIWTASNGMSALPLLSGDSRAVPLGMNSKGDVVGAGFSSDTAILWRTNKAWILQDLIPKGSGWDLDAAYSINDAGQIVGYGKKSGQTHAFLINPKRSLSFPTVRWELVDPYPSLITHQGVTSDPLALSEAGGLRTGLAADGAARLLLRLESDREGEFLVSLDATEGALGVVGDRRLDGVLLPLGSSSELATVRVRTVLKTSRGYQGFAFYKAPQAFDRGGEPDAHAAFRPLVMALGFHPDSGESVFQGVHLTIARPPVVVFHGLWSTMNEAFGGFRQQMLTQIPDLQVTGPDYPNAASFHANRFRVRDGILDALDQFRSKGYAVARADVFGHSMGGVLSRIWSQHPRSLRAENFFAGDINRLVTLDSPLHGSFVADGLLALDTGDPDLYRELALVMRSLGSPIDEGAGRDLSTLSDAMKDANARSGITPSHAIIGDYEVEGAWIGLIKSIGASFDMTGLARLLQRLFPSDAPLDTHSDLLVSLSSQAGGLDPLQTSLHPHWHMGAANQSDVVLQCEALLNTWPDQPKYARGFPAWSAPFSRPLSDSAVQMADLPPPPVGKLSITAPLDSGVYRAGQTLTVLGAATDGLVPKSAILATHGVLNENPDGALAFSLTLASNAIGPQTLTLLVQDVKGSWVSASVTIQVKPNGGLLGLRADPSFLSIHGVGRMTRVRMLGRFSDGVEYDVTPSRAGTAYLSSNPSVVTIDTEGQVLTKGAGYATIVASSGGLVSPMDVFVEAPAFVRLKPELEIAPAGSQLVVRVLGAEEGWQLQTSESLGMGAAWTVRREVSADDAENLEIIEPIPALRRFWRFIKP